MTEFCKRPLGLPEGSVRAILALGFTGVTLYMWLDGATVTEAQLALNSTLFGYYFGARAREQANGKTPKKEVQP